MWMPEITKCKACVISSVVLMVAGSVADHGWVRGWALLAAVYAVGLCLKDTVRKAQVRMRDEQRRWSHEVYESAFKQGLGVGREIEAAERFIASTREN